MIHAAPTRDQALCFYRAALSTARQIDRDNDHRVLDADADAAWRAYGSDLPAVVRCDLVLRDFAMLYPGAFAPGPVFGLSGWYDDDPWGVGFERPPALEIAGLFAVRAAPESTADALAQALAAWGLRTDTDAAVARLEGRLSPSIHVIVAGASATAEVARAFVGGQRLSARTQIILVSEGPESRHLLGIACALLREAGVPLFADLRRETDQTAARWAEREKQRLGVAQARLLVTSPDATAGEHAAAQALAEALGADEAIQIAGA